LEFPPEEAASAVGVSGVSAVRSPVLLKDRFMLLVPASPLAWEAGEGRLMMSALARAAAAAAAAADVGAPRALEADLGDGLGVPEGDSWREDPEPGWRDEEGEERGVVPLTGCGATGKVRRWPLARAWKNLRLSRMKRLQQAFWSRCGSTPEVCRYPQCLVPYLDTWRSSITSSCRSQAEKYRKVQRSTEKNREKYK